MKRALLIAAGLLLVVQARAAGVWAPNVWAPNVWAPGTWQGEDIELVVVPDVVGSADADAAETILEGEGLVLGEVFLRCSEETENEIIRQSPAAGASVPLGSAINLYASSGEACKPRGSPGISIGIGIGL